MTLSRNGFENMGKKVFYHAQRALKYSSDTNWRPLDPNTTALELNIHDLVN